MKIHPNTVPYYRPNLNPSPIMAANYLGKLADDVRRQTITMIHQAGSGHVASSLSCVDVLTALRFSLMRWEDSSRRDTFVLSKGHAAPAWYSTLMIAGDIPATTPTLRQIDSPLQGHPDRQRLEFVDASTGALGQGLAMALGAALACRMDQSGRRVWCLLGDGECQEGEVWESLMFASAQALGTTTVFVDHNRSQSDGRLEDVMPIGDLAAKFQAFGWNVQTIDGHDMRQILRASHNATQIQDRPSVIVAETKKGFLRDGHIALNGAHGATFDDDSASQSLAVLGGGR